MRVVSITSFSLSVEELELAIFWPGLLKAY